MKKVKKKATGKLKLTVEVEYPYFPEHYDGQPPERGMLADKAQMEEDMLGFVQAVGLMDGAKVRGTIVVVR